MTVEFTPTDRLIAEQFDYVVSQLKSMSVSMDIDGVEADSATSAVNEFNRIFNKSYRRKDLKDYWRLVEWVKEADPKITNPREFAIKLWNSDDVMGSAPVASGAWLLGNYMKETAHSIHRITSRPSYLKDVTLEWYKNNMPWVDLDTIHIQSDGDNNIKDVTKLSNHKVDTINKLGIDIHFEDSYDEAVAIVSNTNAKVVLVPAPWNEGQRTPKTGIILPTSRFMSKAPVLIATVLDLIGRI